MKNVSPMMQQYFKIKENYKYCLVFFRLGDFYELFFDDAILASRELEITLTGRDYGQSERAPMCGVPHHSVDGYIAKLIERGYKVAICEQVEEAKNSTGIVRREVVRVVTPGTVTSAISLDESKNNYIMCIFSHKNGVGLSVADITTGEFLACEFNLINITSKLLDEIAKFSPAEIICNNSFCKFPDFSVIENKFDLKINICEDWTFDLQSATKKLCDHFNIINLDCFGITNKHCAISASGALLIYLLETQKNSLKHILKLNYYVHSNFMLLDNSTRRNLELTESMRDRVKKGTLLWVLDKTVTAMGARLLRKWIEQPLLDVQEINRRIEAVEELKNDVFLRSDITSILKNILDLERLTSKLIYLSANGRDLIALKNSIEKLPDLKMLFTRSYSCYFSDIFEQFDDLLDIFNLINLSISINAPVSIKEGNIIVDGFDNEVDKFRSIRDNGDSWIKKFEANERDVTGIKNLKIGFNKVFGYYIEITKSYLDVVPTRYTRKQTLANCERFITDELKKYEEMVLGANEKLFELEYTLFCSIRSKLAENILRLQKMAYIIAQLDVLQSLATVADKQNYSMPIVSTNGIIDIKDGRHPVVEKLLETPFIPNNILLDNEDNLLSVITGPNMAGKSTYMRQCALIVLMAQIGSFVPCASANIGVVDRIFTRVGASDDLATGQSTFMLEMTEVSNILNNSTRNSLLILDEIGRGTSTFDGLSIAWAVLEYILDTSQIGAKTLFATHYHELTELEDKLSGVKNYRISIKEEGDGIVFLHKIERGGANNSYGIEVARLAGLPFKVIIRAREILKSLNAADVTKKTKKIAKESKENINKKKDQMDLFSMNDSIIAEYINKLDVYNMSPMQALQELLNLQSMVKGL